MKKIEALNTLEVIDYSASSGEVEYVLTEDTPDNRLTLLEAGFKEEEINEATNSGDLGIDLAILALQYAGAMWWDQDNGFIVDERLPRAWEEIKHLKAERDKLIEGLRKLAKTNAENISEIREWKAKQNDPEVIDLDWYNYVARDILKEIGVTDV